MLHKRKYFKVMRAIVNIRKSSAYAEYNGLTFEVAETKANTQSEKVRITLKIFRKDIGKEVSVDFSENEVIIVDFQKEIQKAYDDVNWDASRYEPYNTLQIYGKKKGLNFEPTYTQAQ